MEYGLEENRVVLAGCVESEPVFSHRVRESEFYKFYLAVARTSGTEDILPVLAERSRIPEGLIPGRFALVTGQIRSFTFRSTDGTERLLTNAYGRSITLLDFPAQKNQVELIGQVLRPPVYRTTPRLREITDLLLAVPRSFQKVDHVPVIAWGKHARAAGELAVGDRIRLIGRLQSRSYQKRLPDGTVKEKFTYEVSCTSFTLL